MSVSPTLHSQVFNWMTAELPDFDESLDLAVCCTSDLELWEGDYEVPQWIMDLAETFIPDLARAG